MANKWREAISEANAVLEKYSVDPVNPSDEVLLRRWDGISRTYLETARTALKATATVTDPKVDGVTFTGTWVVGEVYYAPQNSSNLSGSTSILQELRPGYSYCTPDNMTVVKSRAYPIEQNENSWMYYERFKKEETTCWHNIIPALATTLFDNLRQIKTWPTWATDKVTESDAYYHPGVVPPIYYDRKHLYDIVFCKTSDPVTDAHLNKPVGTTDGEYYLPTTATYVANAPSLGSVVSWWIPSPYWTALGSTIIRECWMEINKDGTYNLYRSIETISTTAIMRTRALQYAGLIRVSGLPILDDTTLTLVGFLDTDEWIYANAKFRIGSDTYRVLYDVQVVSGVATVNITPAVTQATEDACDDDPEQVQVYFEAL